jgi:hypothetical protein
MPVTEGDALAPSGRADTGGAQANGAGATKRALIKTMLAILAIGFLGGLGATWLAIETRVGFGALSAGPWLAWPRTGATDADPYAQAVIAHTGEMPLGLGEGLVFRASTDSTGRRLERTCSYRLSGRVPQSRLWTLTPHDPAGGLLANAAERTGFTSMEVLRDEAGIPEIAIGPEPRPGNWLPMSGSGPFVLLLRLYDTPVSASATGADATALPRIEPIDCP